jgi:hypothetical protein
MEDKKTAHDGGLQCTQSRYVSWPEEKSEKIE